MTAVKMRNGLLIANSVATLAFAVLLVVLLPKLWSPEMYGGGGWRTLVAGLATVFVIVIFVSAARTCIAAVTAVRKGVSRPLQIGDYATTLIAITAAVYLYLLH